MFKSVIEFANALAEGRRFKTPRGHMVFFDEGLRNPFRVGVSHLNGAWGLYDKVTEIKKVVDWTKVPRNTLVEVRDYDNNLFVTRRFVTSLPNAGNRQFETYYTNEDESNALGTDSWNECRLPEDCEVQEDWYKYE